MNERSALELLSDRQFKKLSVVRFETNQHYAHGELDGQSFRRSGNVWYYECKATHSEKHQEQAFEQIGRAIQYGMATHGIYISHRKDGSLIAKRYHA